MSLPYLVLCLIVLPAAAAAQPLDVLVSQALGTNREILSAQKKYEALRQRPAQQSSLPDPTVGLGYVANGLPLPGAGLGTTPTSNIGITFSQEIPFPGKQRLRGEIAGREAEAGWDEYLAVRLSVVSRLKQAYHELHHAMIGLAFVQRYQDVLQDILRTAEARYSVGRAAQQDVFKAQTQFAVFETQRLRYQQEHSSKQFEINALLNRPQNTPIEVSNEMTAGPMPGTLDDILAAAHVHAPMLARGAAAIQRNELAANLARKDYYPDYTVSAGYFNQGGMSPMWQLSVNFKLPAWYWHKQRPAVAEQEFSAGAARHDYAEASITLESGIREQYTQAETAKKLIDLYENSVIPSARLALESSLAGYQSGRLEFVSLFSNFINVVDYEAMDHEEIMRFHVALARLEELTGEEPK